jgi:hypothetical protein
MKQNLSTLQKRYVPLLILLFCLVTLLFACMGILAQGFGPSDDALRHVAKVLSGKAWPEILLVRPEMTMDSHPGWHAILSVFLKLTALDSDKLLIFSVVFFFSLFAIIPVFFFRRPEAWVLTFLIMVLFSFLTMYRILYGRPFIFSMFVTVIFCFLWERLKERRILSLELGLYTLAVALSTWIHGAWYLMALPLAALFLARQWRPFWLMGAATVAGVFLGALFTGRPFVFLYQMAFHAIEAFHSHVFQHQLVTEFTPFGGAPFVLIPVMGLLLWRRASGEWETKWLDHPVFYLGALGWGMGFITLRFWTDWGWPAITVWMAMEIQRLLENEMEASSLKRVGIAVVICLVFYPAFTNDCDSRWTKNAGAPWPDMEKTEHRPWLPDDGGILYNNRMLLFYNVFYQNPHGPWRYALGFEPIWMPKEDLKIYRRIQLSRHSAESFKPWVAKMTKKDRMMLIFDKKPDIPQLEWHEVVPAIWSGRLPRD